MNRFDHPSLQTITNLIQPTLYDWQFINSIPGLMQCDVMIDNSLYTIGLATYEMVFKTDNKSIVILDGTFVHSDPDDYKIYKTRYSLVSHMIHAMDEILTLSQTYSSRVINGFTFGTTRMVNGVSIPQEPLNLLNEMYSDLSKYYYEANKGRSIYQYNFRCGSIFNLHLSENLTSICVHDMYTGNLDVTII